MRKQRANAQDEPGVTHEGEAELVLSHVLADGVALSVVVRALGELRVHCDGKKRSVRRA